MDLCNTEQPSGVAGHTAWKAASIHRRDRIDKAILLHTRRSPCPARIIHERFRFKRRSAAATGLIGQRLAAQFRNVLSRKLPSLTAPRAGLASGSTLSQRTAITNAG